MAARTPQRQMAAVGPAFSVKVTIPGRTSRRDRAAMNRWRGRAGEAQGATVISGLVLAATCLSWAAWASIDRLEENLVDQSLGGVLSTPHTTPAEGQVFTAVNILVVGTDTCTDQGRGLRGR